MSSIATVKNIEFGLQTQLFKLETVEVDVGHGEEGHSCHFSSVGSAQYFFFFFFIRVSCAHL